MTDTTQATQATPRPAQVERSEHFFSTYANTIFFEATAWDLKLIFGQVEQMTSNPPNPPTGKVMQHLAVTIPWPQAKLALFWLRVQVEAAEITVKAKIPIRSDLIPPEVPALTPEQENDPNVREFQELYRRLREEFLASYRE
jgi:hypothetical protein